VGGKISVFSDIAWNALAGLLESRLVPSSTFSEEDLCHCVVESLESLGMFPKGLVRLNYPHPSFDSKRIDLFLPPFSGQDAIACELKYDRGIPSGYSQPRSMKFGSLLNDLIRLGHFRGAGIERFSVYVTDREMLGYLQNPRNGFASLFGNQEWPGLVDNSMFLDSRGASVRKMIKVPIVECSVFCVLSQDVGRNHLLSVLFVSRIRLTSSKCLPDVSNRSREIGQANFIVKYKLTCGSWR
jgi:hypothetical protein